MPEDSGDCVLIWWGLLWSDFKN